MALLRAGSQWEQLQPSLLNRAQDKVKYYVGDKDLLDRYTNRLTNKLYRGLNKDIVKYYVGDKYILVRYTNRLTNKIYRGLNKDQDYHLVEDQDMDRYMGDRYMGDKVRQVQNIY